MVLQQGLRDIARRGEPTFLCFHPQSLATRNRLYQVLPAVYPEAWPELCVLMPAVWGIVTMTWK